MATPQASPTSIPTPFDALTSSLEEAMGQFDIPGAVLGVFHRDDRQISAHGVADRDSQTPVTNETVFRIASLTKIFTATGIASLADAEHRPVTAPVTTWYPSFRLADPDVTANVTMAQALSHSGGWIDPATWPDSLDDPRTLADCVDQLNEAEQFFPAGTLFNYSNSAYQLAGHILSSKVNLPYEQALQERVLEPLGLRRTGFFREQFADQAVAAGHVGGEDGLEVVDPWHVHPAIHPTGGLLSTADDMLSFLRLHAGLLTDDSAPLTGAQRLAMMVPHGPGGSLGPIAAESIGLGWMRTTIGGRQVAMSFGSDAGLAAGMAVAPDDQFGFVLLSNADPGLVVAAQLLTQAVELYLQTSAPEPLPVSLSPAVLEQSTGRFTIPGELTFDLSVRDGDLWIAASMAGEPIPDMGGQLIMLSATEGWFEMGPMRLLVDLVRDETGQVAWLRFAARLARRDG